VNGKCLEKENSKEYIETAINLGFNVEIDVRYYQNKWFLGHDCPLYEIEYNWLIDRKNKLWVHCKNTNAITELLDSDIHYFWHENDTLTLTSKNFIWTYPNKQPIKNSISVLPELNNDDISQCIGICSDYIKNY
jgi:hypothetical protein